MKRGSASQSSRPINRTEAQAMFQRTLTGWISDNLRLGRSGLDRPSARNVGPRSGAQRSAWSLSVPSKRAG